MRPLAILLVVAAGCGSETGSVQRNGPAVVDGGAHVDAGQGVDAGPVDAGQFDTSPHLATDVAIGEVSLYQSVKVSIASNGAAVARTKSPVVANRAALVRVGVTPSAGFVARQLTCELVVDSQVFSTHLLVSRASDDSNPSSFFVFNVPADAIAEQTSWSARILDANALAVADGQPSPARVPADGTLAPLGARSDSGGIQITLVPIQWNGDGSGRLPDTSPDQLARITNLLRALYPLVEVDLAVHAPLPYSGGLTFTGNIDFGDVNSQLQALRQTDGADAKAYYYGLVEPDDTFDDYCGGSCVTGQSYVVDDPSDDDLRVGAGQGWGGDDSAWTLAHEVGHELGRYHAPCSAGSPDPDFPYAGGGTGVWGYDARSGQFISPDDESDFMGYCDPTWSSDYTYNAIFDRLLAVHGAAPRARGRQRDYRFLALLPDGSSRWRSPVRLSHEVGVHSAHVDARWLDDAGQVLRTDRVAVLPLGEGSEVELALPSAPMGAVELRAGERKGERSFAVPRP
ncbi:MAG: hypothetical protein JST54_23780 [Deltaproteobacteria bacterium]|nr:hypothetical protein [Deltaproteobacteria bacterium]